MNKGEGIPVRELLFCRKGEQVQEQFVIRLVGPYLVREDEVNFRFDEGTAGCTIEFAGLNEDSIEVFGVDKLHALTLAVDIDPYLRSMASKYDFFWKSGEPYFDE